MAAEMGPSEPLFTIVVGCFLAASIIVTCWLLFGNPHKQSHPDRSSK